MSRSAAKNLAYVVLTVENGPVGDVPYPACLRPIAEAVVDAIYPMIEAECLRAAAQAWADDPDQVGDSLSDARNWLRDRADYVIATAPVEL